MKLPFNRKALLATAAIIVVAAPAVVLSTRLMAAESDSVDDDGPGSGTLMLTGPGIARALPAVRLGTDMDVTVSGSIARVRVTQAFRNTSKQWMEASYLYPLPEDGAVDSLKMVVGNRVITGKIKVREDAQKIYEEAKAQGQKAGLVEQQRPNMFTNKVANVGPGETVMVSIEYQAPVRQVAGNFALRLPLVVGPRYVPPHSVQTAAGVADGKAVTSAPVLDPKAGKINPVSITVHLSPGFAPANVASPYHRVSVDGAGTERTVRLAAGEAPSDRDFVLNWRSASADPTVGLFRQSLGGKDYVMASIVPAASTDNAAVPPREMVFVIDNSGSMSGASMDEAKASLVHALKTLRPQDRFNVIRFDDTMTKLFEHSVGATPDQVSTAVKFAEGLEASGGTEMLPALKAALADSAAAGGSDMVRQIIFMTDGEVSNEEEMAAAIGADRGRSRVFLVGIGSAPNTYLMSRMAEMGRGTFTHIGKAEEVTARMEALLDMLRRPALQDVKVRVDGSAVDLTPKMLPDVYAGEPLVLLGQTDRLAGTLTVSGRIAGRPWSQTVRLGDAAESPAVAKLWANRRVRDVETQRTLGKVDEGDADKTIADIGLAFSLVTRRTSLVAVDTTPSRPAGTPLRFEDLPINLPAGWDFDGLFGGEAAQAALANASHKAKAAAEDTPQAVELPETALNFTGALTQGLVFFLLGALGLLLLRRRSGAK